MSTLKPTSGKAIEDVLFKPLAPYFADTYTTLISVAQGVALATLLLMIDKLFFSYPNILKVTDLHCLYAGKIGVSFLVICLIWHRYATANQYYCWPLGPLDAIIPLGLSVTQGVLCLSVPSAAHWFAWLLSAASLFGAFGYMNTAHNHGLRQVRALYVEHYEEYESGLGEFLYVEVQKYENAQQKHMFFLSAVMLFWFSNSPTVGSSGVVEV